MHLNKRIFVSFLLILIFCLSSVLLSRSAVESTGGNKRLDIFHYHNIGNIWLRISNYGFFGSGDDVVPQYPSLEYPGGSGIDYLYQGALWFGAKKYKRNEFGQKLYWQDPNHEETPGTEPAGFGAVIDTLVSAGFDGDADMYEFLPAYNELEENALGPKYDQYQLYDQVASTSIRNQKTGVDDDGDGKIDEDPVGFQFPYRPENDMPEDFHTFQSNNNQFRGPVDRTICDADEIIDNEEIWFPFGFVDLGYIDSDSLYNFSQAQDDDGDGLKDEDGYPTSEQDYIGYYYDYSPFGTPGSRWWGGWNFSQEHTPLNIRVRQASFQWSYEYIKNLVYLEFDITNMNTQDTLYDCAMGIYMDSDVGPQSWSSEKASDDVSSYVSGSGYEFAYTYDADKDGGLSTGYVGCRVCTPDPEQLDFACWTWKVGNGPRDEDPGKDRNEKYWLMTHNTNPFDDKFTSLKEFPNTQIGDPVDTRFLFAFYGDMQGLVEPGDSTWNLKPGETMKIVAAVFPGATVEELKRTSVWAKTVYKEAQTLTNVVKPDTFVHYKAPGPPDIPNMYLENQSGGKFVDVYWDNRSEFTIDNLTIQEEFIGYQNRWPFYPSYSDTINEGDPEYNTNATLDPTTAYRLRHDFQGYTLWKASNSGEKDAFMRVARWDKIDTPQDIADYNSCMNLPIDSLEVYYGGNLGVNTGLPNKLVVTEDNNDLYLNNSGDTIRWTDYYRLDEEYHATQVAIGDTVYGLPIYAAEVDSSIDAHGITAGNGRTAEENESLLFKNPNLSDELFIALYDDALIPLGPAPDGPGNADHAHLGQSHPGFDNFAEMKKNRLARRYYKNRLMYPERGVENYIAVTTYDRGIPSQNLGPLESGRDADANMQVIFPGPNANSSMDSIYVAPNPYIGQSKFDGRREEDIKGDRSKRLWFVNLPEKCTIRIYTLAGDLVDKIEHDGQTSVDVINPSKASQAGIAASGMHPWDLLSKNNQIIAPGVYIYSVEDHATEKVKLDKFVIIK